MTSKPSPTHYRQLDSAEIVRTVEMLARRIDERFSGSGLHRVACAQLGIARLAMTRAARIRQPNIPLRLLMGLLVLGLIGVGTVLVQSLRWNDELLELEHFIQSLEAALGAVVFLGAAIVFLFSVELRWKRARALNAIHELRSLAHIIDMHQLTKDPERVTGRGPATASSPVRTMTSFELGRYLDYCTEMLSLVSKIGALYVQGFPDPVAIEAVDRLAQMTTDLSRNIWQKIMILETVIGAPHPPLPAASAPAPNSVSPPASPGAKPDSPGG